MKLKIFAMYASSAIVGLLLLQYAPHGIRGWLSPEAPKEPVNFGTPLSDTVRSAFCDPSMEACFSQPVVMYNVSENESCIVEEPAWAYDIDKEKNEVVKKVEPTSEEISRLPSMRELYAFLQRKLGEGNSLNEVETDLFKRLFGSIN